MNRALIREEFEKAFNVPQGVFWCEHSNCYVRTVVKNDGSTVDMCVDRAFTVQSQWAVWERAYKTVKYAVAYNANPVRVLTDALAKVSNSLIAAGNVTPQEWHSDNEKRAFVIMKAMGEEGLEAIARSLME